MTELQEKKIQAAIEERRAHVQHMRAEQGHSEDESKREWRRLMLHGVITLAAAMAGGAAIWETIRPAGGI